MSNKAWRQKRMNTGNRRARVEQSGSPIELLKQRKKLRTERLRTERVTKRTIVVEDNEGSPHDE